jgi:hypothetical protein
MDMGDRIQQAWREFVQDHINAKGLRQVIDEIEWDQVEDMDTPYFYVVVERVDGEPNVVGFDGPMSPDFFRGSGASSLVLAIPVYEGMTKADLLDFDAAGESNYYDHPDWSDG